MRSGREAERQDGNTIKQTFTHRGRDTDTDREEDDSDGQTGRWVDTETGARQGNTQAEGNRATHLRINLSRAVVIALHCRFNNA